MSGYPSHPPRYDRRRLEQLVMQQRMRALLLTRKGSGGKAAARSKTR